MENFRIEKNVLVKYTGDEAHVVIPDHVRAIGAQAFAFNTVVESIVVPKGVVTIGERAFDNCHNLVSVDIPKTVSLIEKNAFSSCKKLETVLIPEGVPFIASKTFYMCLALKNVVLPTSVTSISEEAFARCISLEEIAIGDEVLEIGEKAFMECFGLKRLSIGKGVEVLKWNTFAYCKSLEKVALTSSLRQIEYGAFDSCPAITDLYFDATEDAFRSINIKTTRNETLLRAKFHADYTDSIVSVAVPTLVEDVVTEVIEEPTVSEEETALQVSFAIMDEVPVITSEKTDDALVTPEDTAEDTAEETAEEVVSVNPGEQVTLPIEPAVTEVVTPAEVVETVDEVVEPAPVVTPAPVSEPAPAPKKPAVRVTPKSAQSNVSEEFKKAFYQTFLAKLGDEAVAAYREKAEAMTDEAFETQSEALFLVPADDAYEFGCVCLVMGKHNWAFRSFLSAAGKGNAYAQYYVGAAFLFGIDTTKKIVDAARWLTKCKKDELFGSDAERLLVIVDEELDKPENAGLKVKRGNK